MLITTTGKIQYCLPPWKKPSDAQARLCVDQGFTKNFAHVPLSIKYIIFRHFIYAGAIIQLFK